MGIAKFGVASLVFASSAMVACQAENPPNRRSFHEKAGWKAEDYFDDPQVVELCNAILANDLKEIDRLIEAGADVNAKGKGNMTPPEGETREKRGPVQLFSNWTSPRFLPPVSFLGLNHRGTSAQVAVAAFADEIEIDERNLMQEVKGLFQDIDLLQLRAIQGSELMTSNAGNLSAAPQAAAINLAQGATRVDFEFIVMRNGVPVNNARVEFLIQEGISEVLQLTSAVTVTTGADGKAKMSFNATGAIGSTASIFAVVSEGNDQLFSSVTVTVVAP